ncbi:MAG: hypothetical protein R2801_06595 [Chitinophagales bacterium]
MRLFYFMLLAFALVVACKKEDSNTTTVIKSIVVKDSLGNVLNRYAFNFSSGQLQSIQRNNQDWVSLSYHLDTIFVQTNSSFDGFDVNFYFIKQGNYLKSVNAVYQKDTLINGIWIDSVRTEEKINFVYDNNNLVDSINGNGVGALFQSNNKAYDFTYNNNNLTKYMYCYYSMIFVTTYCNGTMNNTYFLNNAYDDVFIPCQNFLQSDLFFQYPMEYNDDISLSYIAQLCGLTVGYKNKDLIKQKESYFQYSYERNNEGKVNKVTAKKYNNFTYVFDVDKIYELSY